MHEPYRGSLTRREGAQRGQETGLDVRHSHGRGRRQVRRPPPPATRLSDSIEGAGQVVHQLNAIPVFERVRDRIGSGICRTIHPNGADESANQTRPHGVDEAIELRVACCVHARPHRSTLIAPAADSTLPANTALGEDCTT